MAGSWTTDQETFWLILKPGEIDDTGRIGKGNKDHLSTLWREVISLVGVASSFSSDSHF
jgi:hypothetical protein